MTGQELKALREKAGLTMRQLVRQLKIYRINGWQIFRWERDERRIPKKSAQLILSVLDWPTAKQPNQPAPKVNIPTLNQREPLPASPRAESFFPGWRPAVQPVEGRRKQRMISTVLVSEVLKLASAYYEANTAKYGIVSLFRFGTYETALRQFLGHKLAEQLTTGDLDAFAKNHYKGRGRSIDWLCHRQIFFLARAYDLALARGLVTKRVLITGESNGDYFTHDEYQRQLASLAKDYAKDITTFAYLTGRSQGEIFNLKWESNYDPERKAMCYGSRVIPLEVLEGLRELIDVRLSKRIDGCPWIFHNNGRQIFNSSLNWEWRRACKASGVKRHFRGLQPAAARNLKIAGYEPKQVIKLTGYTEPVPVIYRYEIVAATEPGVYGLPESEAKERDTKRAPIKPAVKSTNRDEDLFEVG